MSFKLLYTNLAGPQGDFLVDPTIQFEAGMLGTLQGNSAGLPVVQLATSGSTPIGIIDDNKATAFLATVIAETVVSGQTTLNNANIVGPTFASALSAGGAVNTGCVVTSATNGTITCTVPGVVNYSYYIPGKAGDDTTLASGKCTLWLQSGEYATDVYEVTATSGTAPYNYNVGEKVFASVNHKLTQTGSGTSISGVAFAQATVVGYVTKKPSAGNPFLHFYKV